MSASLPRAVLLVALVAVPLPATSAPKAPVWVKTGGETSKFPRPKFLVGFGAVDRTDAEALVAAKNAAAEELARSVRSRIESKILDQETQSSSGEDFLVQVQRRVSTDIVIPDLAYQTYVGPKRTFALAFVERSRALSLHRAERKGSLEVARRKIEEGEAHLSSKAWERATLAFESVAAPVAAATSADSTVNVLRRSASAEDEDAAKTLSDLQKRARAGQAAAAEALKTQQPESLEQLANGLGYKLWSQGVSTRSRFSVEALHMGHTAFSSPFGHALAKRLEVSITQRGKREKGKVWKALKVRGSYYDLDDKTIEVMLTAHAELDGRPIAGASGRLPKKAIPAGLPLRPVNATSALHDQPVIAAGEQKESTLRAGLAVLVGGRELTRQVTLEADTPFRVNVRLNRAATFRVIYHLATGPRVLMVEDQRYRSGDAGRWKTLADEFEVAPPLGVERMQLIACTQRLPRLSVKKATIDGESYDVVDLDAIASSRGLMKVKGKNACAEAVLTLTTVPGASG